MTFTALFFFGICSPSLADQFRLKDGRVLEGKLIRTDTVKEGDKEVTRLAIEIEPGVLVRIHQSDLARSGYLKPDPKEEEYRQQVAQIEETADAHYQMARWCTEQGLRSQSRAHYLRTIELDPNHKLARAALDHTLSAATGRWIKREDEMAERGKIHYKGKWQFPEYIPMDETLEQEKLQRASVQKEINRLHSDFLRGNPAKAQEAVQLLSQIDNPLAIDFVSQLLLDKQRGGVLKATPALKQIYITLLARFDSAEASIPLAHLSVIDSDQTVRVAALDVLAKQGRQYAIPVISSYLRSKNNEIINRAGYALGQLSSREAILPMIDALVTRHEFQGPANNNFNPGGGGLSMGGPKKQMVDMNNEGVLAALSQVTGQGQLGYDKARWRAWYASLYGPPVDDLRRDP